MSKKRMRVRCIKGSHEFTRLYHPEELMSLFEADYELEIYKNYLCPICDKPHELCICDYEEKEETQCQRKDER